MTEACNGTGQESPARMQGERRISPLMARQMVDVAISEAQRLAEVPGGMGRHSSAPQKERRPRSRSFLATSIAWREQCGLAVTPEEYRRAGIRGL